MNLLVVPGDGIGPEITEASLKAVEVLVDREKLDLDVENAPCGLESLAQYGITVRDEDLDRAKAADGVILGPMSVKDYPPASKGGRNVPGAFRRWLGLYANIRPVYTRPALPAVAKQIDLVFVRENLEDFYTDRNMFSGSGEFMPTEDMAIAIGKITKLGSERIAHTAFRMARTRERRTVTVIHKAPVMTAFYGLFLDTVTEVSKEYPDVTLDDLMVDAAAAHLVRTPERFDVVLAPNMFGDILSDEAAELAGSLGLGASLNHGDDHAVANAAHGSASDIAGKDLANPAAMMLSVAMLLEHMGTKAEQGGFINAGQKLREAVDSRLERPESRTRDVGGQLGTAAFTDEVVKYLATA